MTKLILVSTLQASVLLKLKSQMKATQKDDVRHDFMRLRMVRCHRVLNLDKSLSVSPTIHGKKLGISTVSFEAEV